MKKMIVPLIWRHIKMFSRLLLAVVFGVSVLPSAACANTMDRFSKDIAAGRPLIAHVTVALCDNESQGIVPVGNGLCNGDDPSANLYWGALYGVKTFFSKHKDWMKVNISPPADNRILQRIAFKRTLTFQGVKVSAYVIADAWQGKSIKQAIERFLDISSGARSGAVLGEGEASTTGAPHVIAYVGHNGLMDFVLDRPNAGKIHPDLSAIVLACKSNQYFDGILKNTGTHKLLTTTGFMAPEAYTLEAAITRWFSGGTVDEVRGAAAEAYSKYQKANLSWSKSLFVSDPQ